MYHLQVKVDWTSDLDFRMAECHIPFSGHCDFDL